MIDVITSQLHFVPELVESARVQWGFSRHPENLADVIATARNTEISPSEKRLAKASAGAIALAGGPFNEVLLTLGVGNTLQHTEGILPAIAAVGPITGPMELASGLGMAYLAQTFPDSTEIIKNRYIKVSDSTEISSRKPTEPKQLARTLGVVGLTGTGSAGATLEYELHDPVTEGGEARNKKVAKVAAGMLVGINMAYVSAILGATKGVEAMGAESATDVVARSTGNPILVGGVLAAAVIAKQQFNIARYSWQQRKRRKLERKKSSSVATNSAKDATSRIGVAQ